MAKDDKDKKRKSKKDKSRKRARESSSESDSDSDSAVSWSRLDAEAEAADRNADRRQQHARSRFVDDEAESSDSGENDDGDPIAGQQVNQFFEELRSGHVAPRRAGDINPDELERRYVDGAPLPQYVESDEVQRKTRTAANFVPRQPSDGIPYYVPTRPGKAVEVVRRIFERCQQLEEQGKYPRIRAVACPPSSGDLIIVEADDVNAVVDICRGIPNCMGYKLRISVVDNLAAVIAPVGGSETVAAATQQVSPWARLKRSAGIYQGDLVYLGTDPIAALRDPRGLVTVDVVPRLGKGGKYIWFDAEGGLLDSFRGPYVPPANAPRPLRQHIHLADVRVVLAKMPHLLNDIPATEVGLTAAWTAPNQNVQITGGGLWRIQDLRRSKLDVNIQPTLDEILAFRGRAQPSATDLLPVVRRLAAEQYYAEGDSVLVCVGSSATAPQRGTVVSATRGSPDAEVATVDANGLTIRGTVLLENLRHELPVGTKVRLSAGPRRGLVGTVSQSVCRVRDLKTYPAAPGVMMFTDPRLWCVVVFVNHDRNGHEYMRVPAYNIDMSAAENVLQRDGDIALNDLVMINGHEGSAWRVKALRGNGELEAQSGNDDTRIIKMSDVRTVVPSIELPDGSGGVIRRGEIVTILDPTDQRKGKVICVWNRTAWVLDDRQADARVTPYSVEILRGKSGKVRALGVPGPGAAARRFMPTAFGAPGGGGGWGGITEGARVSARGKDGTFIGTVRKVEGDKVLVDAGPGTLSKFVPISSVRPIEDAAARQSTAAPGAGLNVFKFIHERSRARAQLAEGGTHTMLTATLATGNQSMLSGAESNYGGGTALLVGGDGASTADLFDNVSTGTGGFGLGDFDDEDVERPPPHAPAGSRTAFQWAPNVLKRGVIVTHGDAPAYVEDASYDTHTVTIRAPIRCFVDVSGVGSVTAPSSASTLTVPFEAVRPCSIGFKGEYGAALYVRIILLSGGLAGTIAETVDVEAVGDSHRLVLADATDVLADAATWFSVEAPSVVD